MFSYLHSVRLSAELKSGKIRDASQLTIIKVDRKAKKKVKASRAKTKRESYRKMTYDFIVKLVTSKTVQTGFEILKMIVAFRLGQLNS
jgi:hypothetical protein